MQTGPAKAGQDLKLEAFDITGLKVDVGQLEHGFGWFWKLLRCKDTMFQVSVIVRSCALAEWSQDGDEVDPRLASVVQDSLAGSASVEKAVHLEFCRVLLFLPSRELTYPLLKALLKMIFLFPRWDMLVPWRVFAVFCCLCFVDFCCFQMIPMFFFGQCV